MTMTVTQFNDKLQHPTVAGDTLYSIPYPAGYDFRTLDFTGWLRKLSSVSGGENFTAATFDGTNAYLVANKTHFDTKVGTATGTEITA